MAELPELQEKSIEEIQVPFKALLRLTYLLITVSNPPLVIQSLIEKITALERKGRIVFNREEIWLIELLILNDQGLRQFIPRFTGLPTPRWFRQLEEIFAATPFLRAYSRALFHAYTNGTFMLGDRERMELYGHGSPQLIQRRIGAMMHATGTRVGHAELFFWDPEEGNPASLGI